MCTNVPLSLPPFEGQLGLGAETHSKPMLRELLRKSFSPCIYEGWTRTLCSLRIQPHAYQRFSPAVLDKSDRTAGGVGVGVGKGGRSHAPIVSQICGSK